MTMINIECWYFKYIHDQWDKDWMAELLENCYSDALVEEFTPNQLRTYNPIIEMVKKDKDEDHMMVCTITVPSDMPKDTIIKALDFSYPNQSESGEIPHVNGGKFLHLVIQEHLYENEAQLKRWANYFFIEKQS